MIDNANHMFIERHEYIKLGELLLTIPSLSVDLWISETRQARLGMNEGHGSSEQPLPYEYSAAEAADKLHAVLTTWARTVCEQRGVEYMPLGYVSLGTMGPLPRGIRWLPAEYIESTPGVARWLRRYRMALAMTEGAEMAYGDIKAVTDDAARIICPPARPIVVDEAKVQRARKMRLNARGIAIMARELGEEYRNLNVRRIQTLATAHKIEPLPGPWFAEFDDSGKVNLTAQYVVGEVLDAHLTHRIRRQDAN